MQAWLTRRFERDPRRYLLACGFALLLTSEGVIVAVTAIAAGAANVSFTSDVMLRPARAALHGPLDDAPASNLVGRLALSIPATSWVAAVAVGYMTTTRGRAGAGHLLVVYGIAA